MPCAFHPDRPKEYTCERCSLALCHDCGVEILGHVYCLKCKEEVLRAYERGEEPPSGPERGPSPFERRREIGFMRGLLDTLGECLFHPVTFFSRLEPEKNLGDAVLYGVILATLGAVAGQVWQLALGYPIEDALGIEPASAAIQRTITIAFLVLSPVLAVVQGFLSGCLCHLSLFVLGGARRGFPATARAIFYGFSGNVWALLPLCGGLVGGIWGMVLSIIGMAKLHEIETWKAVVAYFLPMVVCACSIGGFLILGLLLARP